jgi:hypothetical protein
MSQPEHISTPEQENPAAPAGPPDSEPRFVEGFPEGKPIADMSDAEKAAYWQNYARKNAQEAERARKMVEDKFHGLTADQIKALADDNEALRAEKMTASEKAVAAASKEAAKAAEAAAAAKYLPQIQGLQVKSVVSGIAQDEDQANAFMMQTNPAAFFDDKGEFDRDKLMGVLTALWGTTSAQSPPSGPRWQNFGQFTPPPPPSKPGAGGSAEAQKRYGTKTT